MAYLRELMHWFSINAPFDTQEEWDNSGLMIGSEDTEMTGIYIDMDITLQTIQQAKQAGCNVILTHHPLLFQPLKAINFNEQRGAIIKEAMDEGMQVVAAHTNWDVAERGTNHALANVCGMKNASPLEGTIGWMADGEGKTVEKWLTAIAQGLEVVPKYSGSPFQKVERILLCGGAGGDLVEIAEAMDAQLVLTGEAKHHESLLGERGVCLVEVGHYESEYPALVAMQKQLSQDFDIPVVVAERQPTMKTWRMDA